MEDETRRAFIALDGKLVDSFGKVEREVWHLRIAIVLTLVLAASGCFMGLVALIWR
jgi:hypothetical protein